MRRALECLHNGSRIPRYDCVRWNAFRYHRASGDDGVVANGHALQNHRVHSDPDVVADLYRRRFQFWPRRPIFEVGGERLRIDQSLRGFERMKIRVRHSDAPRNQAVCSDLNLLFGHDERAIEKCEIADGAAAVFADCKRAAGVTGNVLANHNRAGLFADHFAKDLRAFAVKAFTEFDVRRNRVRPPILLHMSILFDVAHVGNFPEANSFA